MTLLPAKPLVKNNPRLAGCAACPQTIFGPRSRYSIQPFYTRFHAVMWFVFDAEFPDDDGLPSVIRQEWSYSKALEGLDMSDPHMDDFIRELDEQY